MASHNTTEPLLLTLTRVLIVFLPIGGSKLNLRRKRGAKMCLALFKMVWIMTVVALDRLKRTNLVTTSNRYSDYIKAWAIHNKIKSKNKNKTSTLALTSPAILKILGLSGYFLKCPNKSLV